MYHAVRSLIRDYISGNNYRDFGEKNSLIFRMNIRNLWFSDCIWYIEFSDDFFLMTTLRENKIKIFGLNKRVEIT